MDQEKKAVMNIGKSLKIALAKNELTTNELAEKAGISRNYASMLKGHKTCGGVMLKSLADSFDMPVSEFIALGED